MKESTGVSYRAFMIVFIHAFIFKNIDVAFETLKITLEYACSLRRTKAKKPLRRKFQFPIDLLHFMPDIKCKPGKRFPVVFIYGVSVYNTF